MTVQYPLPFPPLQQVLSAQVTKGEHGLTHHLKLQLSHGSMPDSVFEVRAGLLMGACVRGATHYSLTLGCCVWSAWRAALLWRPSLLPLLSVSQLPRHLRDT